MFKSLHMKLVLILVLLIFSVMAVTGTFLINSVNSYQLGGFKTQIGEIFTTEFIDTLSRNSREGDAPARLKEMIFAYSGSLGLDSYRNFYILSRRTGGYLAGSNDLEGAGLDRSPNILAAMSGRVGDHIGVVDAYMEIAIPVGGDDGYIIVIRDNKQRLRDLNWILFVIVLQAMLLGMIIAIFLSFFLSKAMTTPIENLTRSASLLSAGDFSVTDRLVVHSSDEIGILTKTFRDMATVLKETIEEAEGERNKLNTLFQHMADGVAAFLQDGTLLHMNPAAEKMLGIRFKSSLRFSEIFPKVTLPETDESGDPGFLAAEYKRNGRDLRIYFAVFGLSENENGLMAVIHDSTEENRMETARREFVANVSHELRTPLTNIKSYTETLLEDPQVEEDTRQSFLEVVLNETDRMAHIVSDLLTLSKLDYGRLEMKFSRFSLAALLNRSVSAMYLTAKSVGCELSMEMADDLPEIMGDRERIEQVVVNILSNAVKYTPEGGKVHLTAGCTAEESVCIVVKDTGMGIGEEHLPHVFERFYRVDKARSREKGGTGLGLAIAKEIVTSHNGTIGIESQLGKGTQVTVTLPISLLESKR